ncbi:MAG TPA: UdgX family uracil-DNA binding protein [Woeseiaceae bacterium]|nr:UdgX family uracil-DNA binding protein [Woeseiaceae bacterium]
MSRGEPSAADFLPERRNMRSLPAAARSCRGCDLWQNATQTVFGEGLKRARLMLVGEMPGNDEDLAGRPFVGPAGRILNQALDEARIERRDAYVTNVVKHFKWEPRGKRRLHKKPNAAEVNACRPWFDAELAVLQPDVLVCLGATAAKALLGPAFRVSKEHGRFVDSDLAPYVTATGHPSAVLRARDSASRTEMMRALVADFCNVAEVLNRPLT